jgi:mono/diheme cytochrome c family protein
MPLSPVEARRAEQLVRKGDPARGLPACAACHGTGLAGVAPHVPGLLGLPVDYLNSQLGAWRQGHRRAREPDCMAQVARAMPLEDVALVSRWLATQPVPAGGRPAATAPATWPLRCGSLEKAPAPAAPVKPSGTTDAEQGAYLALLGNCAGCHTAPGGAPYAGGRAIATPFGAVYASNLTPDTETGLGRWTADSFWRALREGRSHDGRRLIPAFPYTSYTHLTRQDSDRLFAYLRSLPPVRQAQRPHELRFPFGTQPALAVWQWLGLRNADSAKPPPQGMSSASGTAADPLARGAYLVKALGHCAECHAPRNRWGVLGAEMTGGVMPDQRWFAPSLHPLPGSDGPRVTAQVVVELLRTGRHRHGSASGPMAGVVLNSTQHWAEADLQAVAAYLMTLPARAPTPAPSRRPSEPAAADSAALGRRVYADQCAQCHGDQGQGIPGLYSPLAGNPSVTQPDIRNLVQMLQHGGFAPATRSNPRPFGMPPQELSVAETTAVLNHLRQSWGHRAPAVNDLDVIRLR